MEYSIIKNMLISFDYSIFTLVKYSIKIIYSNRI